MTDTNSAASDTGGRTDVTTTSTEIPAAACGCVAQSDASDRYVFALGRIQPRFPSVSLEKEFIQATGRADLAGLTDHEALHNVLSERHNRYLARHMCWVFTVENLDTYIVVPRESGDVDLLIEAVRPAPRPHDVDVIIGIQQGIAPPGACNGLMIPVVAFDQIYSFDVDSLLRSIPRPEAIPEERFGATAEELFYRIMQLADNAGATDEHRALNYVAVRYPGMYATVADAFGRNFSLARVEVVPSRLSTARKIVDIIFTFLHRETGLEEMWFVRVDVTEEFPFLLTKMNQYFRR